MGHGGRGSGRRSARGVKTQIVDVAFPKRFHCLDVFFGYRFWRQSQDCCQSLVVFRARRSSGSSSHNTYGVISVTVVVETQVPQERQGISDVTVFAVPPGGQIGTQASHSEFVHARRPHAYSPLFSEKYPHRVGIVPTGRCQRGGICGVRSVRRHFVPVPVAEDGAPCGEWQGFLGDVGLDRHGDSVKYRQGFLAFSPFV
mmetsp:Transcript_24256/g.54053  ORF Transcript_24256/g.54053 Transcript_24256/m.54053 type:complete len:200 (+) Transcript_24256:1354-1953(+)